MTASVTVLMSFERRSLASRHSQSAEHDGMSIYGQP